MHFSIPALVTLVLFRTAHAGMDGSIPDLTDFDCEDPSRAAKMQPGSDYVEIKNFLRMTLLCCPPGGPISPEADSVKRQPNFDDVRMKNFPQERFDIEATKPGCITCTYHNLLPSLEFHWNDRSVHPLKNGSQTISKILSAET